jgi:hypothetical protein
MTLYNITPGQGSALPLQQLEKRFGNLGTAVLQYNQIGAGQAQEGHGLVVIVQREAIVIIKLSDTGDQALVIQILSRYTPSDSIDEDQTTSYVSKTSKEAVVARLLRWQDLCGLRLTPVAQLSPSSPPYHHES